MKLQPRNYYGERNTKYQANSSSLDWEGEMHSTDAQVLLSRLRQSPSPDNFMYVTSKPRRTSR